MENLKLLQGDQLEIDFSKANWSLDPQASNISKKPKKQILAKKISIKVSNESYYKQS